MRDNDLRTWCETEIAKCSKYGFSSQHEGKVLALREVLGRIAQVDGHPQGGDGTAPFMTSAVGTEGTDAPIPLSQSITPPEVGGELFPETVKQDQFNALWDRHVHAEWGGVNEFAKVHTQQSAREYKRGFQACFAALSTPEVVDGTAGLVEALIEARAALHQHYVDWDGEPEDAVPLQLARARCDAALSQHRGVS